MFLIETAVIPCRVYLINKDSFCLSTYIFQDIQAHAQYSPAAFGSYPELSFLSALWTLQVLDTFLWTSYGMYVVYPMDGILCGSDRMCIRVSRVHY